MVGRAGRDGVGMGGAGRAGSDECDGRAAVACDTGGAAGIGGRVALRDAGAGRDTAGRANGARAGLTDAVPGLVRSPESSGGSRGSSGPLIVGSEGTRLFESRRGDRCRGRVAA